MAPGLDCRILSPVSCLPFQLGPRVVFTQCFTVGLKHANDLTQGFPQRTCVAIA